MCLWDSVCEEETMKGLIIIPAYNCTATLGRTLASLAAQTDPDFSVIIVDDCSTENLLPIVDDYSNKLHIKYIRKPENQGCGMARQTGIDNVTASHFTFLDADDILMPYAVEVFNEHIRAHPQCEYVHSHFYEQTITQEGNPAYLLHTNGFVWCHGKLYSAEAVKRWGMRNHPAVHWADDSYFNSTLFNYCIRREIALTVSIINHIGTHNRKFTTCYKSVECWNSQIKFMITGNGKVIANSVH